MTSFFSDLLTAIGERGRNLVDLNQASSEKKDLADIAQSLLSQKGEASGIALASEFFSIYENLDDAARDSFFSALAEQFGPDLMEVEKLIADFRTAPSVETVIALHRAGEPRRQELFRRLNQAPGGTQSLVRLREDLLIRLRNNPKLAEVDADLHHLFLSWFNRGFLVLKRITWATSATILEKIIKYEAVHEIGNWEELRRRIEPSDRRCYAFFHPALTDEPLIFVEVALTDEIPGSIAPVIASNRDILSSRDARVATFYSISNCQRGLSGVSFGSFLIKQVAQDLQRELPHIKTFVTLSPVPGFMKWLDSLKNDDADGSHTLPQDDRDLLSRLGTKDWMNDEEMTNAMEDLLLPLVAYYLLHAKDHEQKPLDPVARFHLGNGARLERINWQADISKNGLSRSAGIMVNYLYDLGDIEKNHEAYSNNNSVVASGVITRLAKNSASSLAMEPTQ